MYADDVNFTKLNLEIARFNSLAQSSGFTFKNDATALDVLQWLSKHRLCESTPNLFMSLKLSSLLQFPSQAAEELFQSLS